MKFILTLILFSIITVNAQTPIKKFDLNNLNQIDYFPPNINDTITYYPYNTNKIVSYYIVLSSIRTVFMMEDNIVIHLENNSIINLGNQIRTINRKLGILNKISLDEFRNYYTLPDSYTLNIYQIYNNQTGNYDTFIDI